MHIRLIAAFFACLLCCGEVNCEALEVHTPAEWATSGSLPSSVREIAGVKLSVDTLDGIQRRLGTAKRFRTNKGAAADDFLCYESKSNKFLIIGSGPMGGWSTVTTIAYGTAPPTDIRRNCVPSIIDIQRFAKSSWLIDLRYLEKLLHTKTKVTTDGLHHIRFEREIKSTKNDEGSLFCSSGIQAATTDATRIAFIQVWESCSK